MKYKLINLSIFPLLLLSSCSNVVNHEDFVRAGIAFLKNRKEEVQYYNLKGTYENLNSNISNDINLKIHSSSVYGFDYDLADYKTFNTYEKTIADYLVNNFILRDYIIYTNNADMKTYYVFKDKIKVEDYSLFKNSEYTESYSWNSEGTLIEMTHYFVDDTTNLPIGKVNATITKLEQL